VHIFDAGSAQLLHDLRVPSNVESLLPASRGAEAMTQLWEPDAASSSSFRCVAYSGSVLAAGASRRRSSHLVPRLLQPGDGG